MHISSQSKLSLYPLSIQKDKKHYIVEEPVSGNFFEMPKICVDAIALMNEGFKVGEVASALKQNYPPEEVDMMAFAQQLMDLELVQAVDGNQVNTKVSDQPAGGFTWLSPKVGKFFFNKFSNKLYVILFLCNLLLIGTHPASLPHYQDIFIFDSVALSIIAYMFISLVLIMIHEFGHILAIRAYDLPTHLTIGNRLLLIVFETDLTQAWKLPNKQRNVLFLGGMALEQTIVFLALVFKLFGAIDGALFTGIISLVIFDIFVKTVYQCCLYMKTDIYYVVENITGCYNLMENGKQYLRKWLPWTADDTTTDAFKGEEKIIRSYSVVYLTGMLVTASLFVLYFVPQVYYAYSQVITNVVHSTESAAIWDAVVIFGQTVLLLGMLLFIVVRKRKRNVT